MAGDRWPACTVEHAGRPASLRRSSSLTVLTVVAEDA